MLSKSASIIIVYLEEFVNRFLKFIFFFDKKLPLQTRETAVDFKLKGGISVAVYKRLDFFTSLAVGAEVRLVALIIVFISKMKNN